jgi:hypothetical protein
MGWVEDLDLSRWRQDHWGRHRGNRLDRAPDRHRHNGREHTCSSHRCHPRHSSAHTLNTVFQDRRHPCSEALSRWCSLYPPSRVALAERGPCVLVATLNGERELLDPIRGHRLRGSLFTLPMGRTLLFPVRGTEATARRCAASFVIHPACAYPGLQAFSGALPLFLRCPLGPRRRSRSQCRSAAADDDEAIGAHLVQELIERQRSSPAGLRWTAFPDRSDPMEALGPLRDRSGCPPRVSARAHPGTPSG